MRRNCPHRRLPALVAASGTQRLMIHDGAFEPDTLTISASQTVRMMVQNKDATPVEFESYDFNREKVIPGQTELPLYLDPLESGTYGCFDDFHPGSKGKLIVEPVEQ